MNDVVALGVARSTVFLSFSKDISYIAVEPFSSFETFGDSYCAEYGHPFLLRGALNITLRLWMLGHMKTAKKLES
jgi:hypothetical protein